MSGSTRGLHRGVGLALGAALLFGVSAPFAKLLLRGATPQLLAGLLYLGSGVGLALVWLARRRGAAREAPLTRRDAPWLAGAIVFGGVLGPLLLMTGLARTPASSASLLLNLEGVFTALLAWFVFRENFDRRIALGMVAIVAGGAVLSWEGRVELGGLAGPLLVGGATLCWAVDNNLTQKVSAGDPVQIAMLKGLVAGSVNTAIALALGAAWPSVSRLAGALVLGFLSYGVSLVLFVLALRGLGTARTGAYFSSAPFVGAAVSLVVFRERPGVAFVVAAALMAVGVWLHVTERHEHEHAHEAMAHEHAHVHDAHHQHAHGPDDPPVTDPTPHSHPHRHEPLVHTHPHYPDIHHRHGHE
ncbi:MAG: DMT family transporter [Gemmatimonadaceae bacterium]|nr:DMT family transporter [Gemmatimonadaceae bacterium]NUQ92550.1 DMT family transporter [Gemmatimonadaceae bacterium]NUR20265.1 DMT family transporter [Gemmatimonadaceae bacterium]NUS99079.1 DMT family transporter [Gemmatimonadaceae bacterium]